MNKKVLVLGLELLFSICFILILFLVLNGNIRSFDNSVYNIISKLICSPMTFIMKGLTYLGSAYALITITILLILFCKNKYNFGINLVVIFLLNIVIKNIVGRPRPIGHNLITEGGYSFPSGHSMISMAVYGFLIYYIYKNVNNKLWKWILIIILSLLILIIGFSRIYLGVHYASDVLAGFLLALIWLITFITIIERKTK